ncbi:MAG: S9 family peptidase [Rickettsiaceae bacterium]|nr:S9 family peptidase [Rickettsiaceae bacterium]
MLKIFKTIVPFLLSVFIFNISNASDSMTSSEIIPRKVLFGNPDKTAARLSPDGKYITYIAPFKGVLNIWIADATSPLDAKLITNDKGRGIRSYNWCYDNEHILFGLDNKGDENFRIYSYNIKSHKTTLLTPKSGTRASIGGMSHKHPNEILIVMNKRDKKYFDLYKFNLKTGKKSLIFENNKFSDLITDEDLNLRIGVFQNEESEHEYFILKDGKWDPMMKVGSEDTANTHIVGFDEPGNIYLLDSRDRNTNALKIINPANMKEKIIAEDKKSDIGIFAVHPVTSEVQAVASNYERMKYKILDDSIKEDIKILSKVNSGDLNIVSRTIDDKKWIVAYDGDVKPGEYYIYDRESKKTSFLFNSRSELSRYKLSPMNPVVIKARDGLDLVSYLTIPDSVKVSGSIHPKTPLPMVLFVHGGPWARDYYGFNAVHQWLANRGYVVLSVNYRGSSGFGKHFMNAGDGQWGKKMHTDLIDVVNWAVDNGIADPKRVAIMGGSYGGYATLAGLTFTPDVFACGVDIVGPSSIMTLVNSVPPYWKPILSTFKKRIGPWDNKEQIEALNAISPLYHVDKISKPLLIGQGAHDPRVKQAESDQIVSAMRKKNIPVVYVLYGSEGHGFVKPENKLSFYAITEEFLSDVIGGKNEEIGSDLKGADFLLDGKKTRNGKLVKKIIKSAVK